MHNAPAVSYPVGRSFFQALGVALLSVLLVALDVFWLRQGGRWDWPEWISALIGLCVCVLALASWWRISAGTLQWDGGQWHWLTPGMELLGRVGVRLDWQSGMLLEFHPLAGPPRWCWVEQRGDPAAWEALRRAAWGGESAGGQVGA